MTEQSAKKVYTVLITIIATYEISVYNVEYLLKKTKKKSREIALVSWKVMADKEQQMIRFWSVGCLDLMAYQPL